MRLSRPACPAAGAAGELGEPLPPSPLPAAAAWPHYTPPIPSATPLPGLPAPREGVLMALAQQAHPLASQSPPGWAVAPWQLRLSEKPNSNPDSAGTGPVNTQSGGSLRLLICEVGTMPLPPGVTVMGTHHRLPVPSGCSRAAMELPLPGYLDEPQWASGSQATRVRWLSVDPLSRGRWGWSAYFRVQGLPPAPQRWPSPPPRCSTSPSGPCWGVGESQKALPAVSSVRPSTRPRGRQA